MFWWFLRELFDQCFLTSGFILGLSYHPMFYVQMCSIFYFILLIHQLSICLNGHAYMNHIMNFKHSFVQWSNFYILAIEEAWLHISRAIVFLFLFPVLLNPQTISIFLVFIIQIEYSLAVNSSTNWGIETHDSSFGSCSLFLSVPWNEPNTH